jgi:DNA-binding Lrp family transcriptional regulator
MEKLDTVIIAVSFQDVEFNKDLCAKEGLSFHVLSDPDRDVIKKYGVWNEKDDCAQRVTFLIDKDGFIRRIERKVNPETHGKDLHSLMKQWLTGKAVYSVHCARCHGDDGNAENYPFAQKLGGIGNRLTTPKEIIEATRAAGLVDLETLGEAERQALAIYVAGL